MVGDCYCPIVMISHSLPSPFLYQINIHFKWMCFLYILHVLNSNVVKLGFSDSEGRVTMGRWLPVDLTCLSSLATENQ